MPRRDDSGASSVEYGLLVVAIFIAVASSIFFFGQQVFGVYDSSFSRIGDCLVRSCTPAPNPDPNP